MLTLHPVTTIELLNRGMRVREQVFTTEMQIAKFHVNGFYENCGYRVVSEPFMEAGVEHVVMEKYLRIGHA